MPGCAENVEGNAEFCKVLLSLHRDADCGVPLLSAHALGAGKNAGSCEEAVRKKFWFEEEMEVQVIVCSCASVA
jgi:hypothetical protein